MTPCPLVASIPGAARPTMSRRSSSRSVISPIKYWKRRARRRSACPVASTEVVAVVAISSMARWSLTPAQRALIGSGAVISRDLICRIADTRALMALLQTVNSARICSTRPSPVLATGRASGSASACVAAAYASVGSDFPRRLCARRGRMTSHISTFWLIEGR